MGRKFTIFALFYFVFKGKFQVQAPWGTYIWRGDVTEGFLRYDLGGAIFGGAYTWRGLFSEFYGGKSSIQLFRERLSNRVHSTTSKGIVGGSLFFREI